MGGLFAVTLHACVACAAPPGVSNAFDHICSGASRLVSNADNDCDQGQPFSVTVSRGRFHDAWPPAQGKVVRIVANGFCSAILSGSFVVADNHMHILPRIDGFANGQTLADKYGTRWAKYPYHLDRM